MQRDPIQSVGAKGGARTRAEAPARSALLAFRSHWRAAAAFTLAVNLLMLVSPLYMLQVYDRVLTSGSHDTLFLMTALAVGLLAVYAFAEAGRKKVLTLWGVAFAEKLESAVFRRALGSSQPSAALTSAAHDLNAVHKFMSSGAAAPLLDAPYAPLFAALLFLVHPWLGGAGLACAMILLALAAFTEVTSREGVEETSRREGAAAGFLHGVSRQPNAILGMGMRESVFARWSAMRKAAYGQALTSGDVSGGLSAASRSVRQVMQVAMLGLGAYLAMRQEISAGAIIASSIILGRALAPIDQAVGQWTQLVKTRQSLRDLDARLAGGAEAAVVTPSAGFAPRLDLEHLAVGLPGAAEPSLPPLTLTLEAGSILMITGPSGAGKTTLLQTLTGAWPPHAGAVRLGGRALHAWDDVDRGRFVGYMPQDVELLPVSVRDNIARLTEAAPDAVQQIAAAAGCHEAIQRLPQAYDTIVGPGGSHLSAGQRQGVGLARALFGAPVLIVLDEPTAHLDLHRAAHVRALLLHLKELGRIVVVSTHDLRLLETADQVMVINGQEVSIVSGQDFLKRLGALRKVETAASPEPTSTRSAFP